MRLEPHRLQRLQRLDCEYSNYETGLMTQIFFEFVILLRTICEIRGRPLSRTEIFSDVEMSAEPTRQGDVITQGGNPRHSPTEGRDASVLM